MIKCAFIFLIFIIQSFNLLCKLKNNLLYFKNIGFNYMKIQVNDTIDNENYTKLPFEDDEETRNVLIQTNIIKIINNRS